VGLYCNRKSEGSEHVRCWVGLGAIPVLYNAFCRFVRFVKVEAARTGRTAPSGDGSASKAVHGLGGATQPGRWVGKKGRPEERQSSRVTNLMRQEGQRNLRTLKKCRAAGQGEDNERGMRTSQTKRLIASSWNRIYPQGKTEGGGIRGGAGMVWKGLLACLLARASMHGHPVSLLAARMHRSILKSRTNTRFRFVSRRKGEKIEREGTIPCNDSEPRNIGLDDCLPFPCDRPGRQAARALWRYYCTMALLVAAPSE
jgi:hypothetical protein